MPRVDRHYDVVNDPIGRFGITMDGRHWAFAARPRNSQSYLTWMFAVADSGETAANVVSGVHDMSKWMSPDRIQIGVYWLFEFRDTSSWQDALKWALERYAASLIIPVGYQQRTELWTNHMEARCLECGLVDSGPPWHAFPADRTGITLTAQRRNHERLCVIAARMQTYVPVWGTAYVTMGCKGYLFDLRPLVPAQPGDVSIGITPESTVAWVAVDEAIDFRDSIVGLDWSAETVRILNQGIQYRELIMGLGEEYGRPRRPLPPAVVLAMCAGGHHPWRGVINGF